MRFLSGVLAAALVGFAMPAAADEPSFDEWLKGFRAEAAAAGIRKDILDLALQDVKINPRVFELNDNQPEFARNVWDYLDSALSERRITDGRAKFAAHQPLFSEIEKAYGVDAKVIAAIWGQESSYGAVMGDYDVIEALATLAWQGRRTAYGRAQLIGAMKILQNGYADRPQLRGSWAGAMGHTQFIPTTYLTFAVDHDRDGHRDVWANLGDVFGSTANYLAASGYRANHPWGFEAKLPEGFDYMLADVDTKKALAEWRSMGVTTLKGDIADLDPNLRGRVFLPAGAKGPVFIVFQNFEAILKYNNSTAYGLAVAMLSERIAGGGEAINAPWPRGDRALTLSERKALQQALKDQGFDPGPIDGVLGAGSKRALRAWQKSVGLPPDAYASAETLARLTAPAPSPSAEAPESETD
jgi:membrane-bound lytic murein transglycosylase B